jgi:hypothetical protein
MAGAAKDDPAPLSPAPAWAMALFLGAESPEVVDVVDAEDSEDSEVAAELASVEVVDADADATTLSVVDSVDGVSA